jgi:hypothetical protein
MREAVSRVSQASASAKKPGFAQKARIRAAKPARLIAYDFETTRIAAGTPRPLYLTAFGADFAIETPIRDMQHLTALLRSQFLTDDNKSCKFVAWNGNRFDAYFIAAALIRETDLTLRPYMTKSKTLRGLRVVLARDADGVALDEKSAPSWEFLDGIAMLGLVGTPLSKLLDNFAPDHKKLTGAIDFEREEFDADNPAHRAYAMRDSEGLFHAMTRAQQIMIDTFNEPLAVTMGGVCIKIFQAHIPRDVEIKSSHIEAETIIRQYVMRGGFCFCVRQYQGPVWKYDINQAYAAAMREAQLPAGLCIRLLNLRALTGCFMARITASNRQNKIPFYYRTAQTGRLNSAFATTEIHDTWITSIEYEQLKREGWSITVSDAWKWDDTFSMRAYVDKLETLRTTCAGGPSGPIGSMVKATGNHSYGKTVEKIEPVEFILAAQCPPDYLPFFGDGSDPIEHVYWRPDADRKAKGYHQPQIGAWITAHVRMVLRRAALLNAGAWLYADTDCLVFSEDMTAALDIDGKRYGAWKVEESGTPYQIIAKKVYAEIPREGIKPKRSAKGMNVKRLSAEDFTRWLDGAPPEQTQIQINNFLAMLNGAEMYRSQKRKGTRIEKAGV